MGDIELGMQFWNQGFAWPELKQGAELVEELGYDHLWTLGSTSWP